MKVTRIAIAIVAVTVLSVVSGFGQRDEGRGQGRVIVTILPSHSGEEMASVSQQDLKVKVNGKQATVTGWTPLRSHDSRLELMLLIDGSARASLGQQFSEITAFVKEMPANSKVGIAYMMNGTASIASPLSSDAAQVVNGLRLSAGSPGSNASPYFCLSDLAKNWPSNDQGARREVVMITDGVDNYNRRLDLNDPYVNSAINDSIRAGLVVYAMYWQNRGRANSTDDATNAGQNLLAQTTQATGGYSYWSGYGNPVSYEPYFADLRRRLNHQYALTFSAPLGGKPEVKDMKLDLHVTSAKVDAPQRVFVSRASGGATE